MCNSIIRSDSTQTGLSFLLSEMEGSWSVPLRRPGWRAVHPRIAEAGADEPLNRSSEVEAFYTSWKWRKCRKAFYEFKGGLCERCLKRGIIQTGSKDQPLEVHHKIPLNAQNVKNPDIALGWANLELLCKQCHDKEKERKQKRWKIREDGRVIL